MQTPNIIIRDQSSIDPRPHTCARGTPTHVIYCTPDLHQSCIKINRGITSLSPFCSAPLCRCCLLGPLASVALCPSLKMYVRGARPDTALSRSLNVSSPTRPAASGRQPPSLLGRIR